MVNGLRLIINGLVNTDCTQAPTRPWAKGPANLEITVGKSENNSRKRKDKQWIETGSNTPWAKGPANLEITVGKSE